MQPFEDSTPNSLPLFPIRDPILSKLTKKLSTQVYLASPGFLSFYPFPLKKTPAYWNHQYQKNFLATHQNKNIRCIAAGKIIFHQTTLFFELLKRLDVSLFDFKKVRFSKKNDNAAEKQFFARVVECIPNVVELCFCNNRNGEQKLLFKLQKLLHLKLDQVNEKDMGVISQLQQLKGLIIQTFQSSKKGASLISRLRNLQKLEIYDGKEDGKFLFSEIAQSLSKLVSLKLFFRELSINEQHFKSPALFQNLKELNLNFIKNWHRVLFSISKHLRQIQILELKTWFYTTTRNIPKREIVGLINNCRNLQKLEMGQFYGTNHKDKMKLLREMKIMLGSRQRRMKFWNLSGSFDFEFTKKKKKQNLKSKGQTN